MWHIWKQEKGCLARFGFQKSKPLGQRRQNGGPRGKAGPQIFHFLVWPAVIFFPKMIWFPAFKIRKVCIKWKYPASSWITNRKNWQLWNSWSKAPSFLDWSILERSKTTEPYLRQTEPPAAQASSGSWPGGLPGPGLEERCSVVKRVVPRPWTQWDEGWISAGDCGQMIDNTDASYYTHLFGPRWVPQS